MSELSAYIEKRKAEVNGFKKEYQVSYVTKKSIRSVMQQTSISESKIIATSKFINSL